jgi:hypothetical protein
MKKVLYILIFIFSFSVLSAQEKLSKEEKARREKNIQAGNPFVKYGCKAPVATLSKGKYLEVQDLDSIVTIGTMRWHVDNKQIVGRIVRDTLNPDAQPIGDAPGMWMSPDPLSEEFPSWSPYTMCFDNPMKFKDPDGRAPQWIVGTDGNAVTHTTNSDGSIKWSSNASADTQRIGNSLNNTATGRSQLDKLDKSDIKVSLSISSKDNTTREGNKVSRTYGETDQGSKNGTKADKNGNYSIKEASITIYEGTINNGISAGTPRLDGLTTDQAIGAIAGHEIVHATDKAEINKDFKYTETHEGQQRPDREVKTKAVETKIIEESKQNK